MKTEIKESTHAKYLTSKQAAELLGFTPRFLDNLRYRGCGPAYCRLGRQVRYLEEDVHTWAQQVRFNSAARDKIAAATPDHQEDIEATCARALWDHLPETLREYLTAIEGAHSPRHRDWRADYRRR